MIFEGLGKLLQEIDNRDLSKIKIPEGAFSNIDIPDLKMVTVDPETTIIGDIKRQIIAQNEISAQQNAVLIEQNKLLADNYNKLKEIYDAQTESYNEAKADLKKSRLYNIWMMVIAIIAMVAAVVSPIVSIIISG